MVLQGGGGGGGGANQLATDSAAGPSGGHSHSAVLASGRGRNPWVVLSEHEAKQLRWSQEAPSEQGASTGGYGVTSEAVADGAALHVSLQAGAGAEAAEARQGVLGKDRQKAWELERALVPLPPAAHSSHSGSGGGGPKIQDALMRRQAAGRGTPGVAGPLVTETTGIGGRLCQAIVRGLRPGRRYEFRVSARGKRCDEWSAPSVRGNAVRLPSLEPGVPGQPQVVAGSGFSLLVRWSAPRSRGAKVRFYEVCARRVVGPGDQGNPSDDEREDQMVKLAVPQPPLRWAAGGADGSLPPAESVRAALLGEDQPTAPGEQRNTSASNDGAGSGASHGSSAPSRASPTSAPLVWHEGLDVERDTEEVQRRGWRCAMQWRLVARCSAEDCRAAPAVSPGLRRLRAAPGGGDPMAISDALAREIEKARGKEMIARQRREAAMQGSAGGADTGAGAAPGIDPGIAPAQTDRFDRDVDRSSHVGTDGALASDGLRGARAEPRTRDHSPVGSDDEPGNRTVSR